MRKVGLFVIRYYLFAFIVYEFLFATYFYNIYLTNKNEYHKESIHLVQNSLESAVHAYEMTYDDAYARQSDTIAKLTTQANGASTKERDGIREILLSEFMEFFNYEKLNALNGFLIFDKDGRALLRFHKPYAHDDKIIEHRYSLQKLYKTFSFQKGFEIGIFQDSYRFQYPLFYDGNFVGSYEYSVDSQSLINEMQNFYGDAHQALFRANNLKNLIENKSIEKFYNKVSVGSDTFYMKKNHYVKVIDKDRFNYLKDLKEFQQALHGDDPKVVDYSFDGKDYAVVIYPIHDIEGKIFAYILVHLNGSLLEHFKYTFMIEMFFVTLFGLMLGLFIYKELQNRRYFKELIDLQHDLIVVNDGKGIIDTNRAFLEFFCYESLEEYKHDHECICDMFIEVDGYLTKENKNGIDWINHVKENPDEEHKVKMLDCDKEEHIFSVEIEKISESHKFFILFRDITKDLSLKQELEERANYDGLTQIFNRNRFEFFLDQELKKAQRYGNVFSLIMFDIDHFKKINDTYGHDVGDHVLRELTYLIKQHTRDVDIFARWGGEEFMIITQTNIYQTEMFAEKLRAIVDKHTFSDGLHVTCSFGITQYRKNDSIESIVKRCDNMLYSAKESGRNCVASLK